MELVHKKKQMFSLEIRREQKLKYFRTVRANALDDIELHRIMEDFVNEKGTTIPDRILEAGTFVESQAFKVFLHLIMNNELRFIRKKQDSLNTWFFDCTQPNNLYFFAQLCRNERADHLFGHFFHSTIQAYRIYYQTYLEIKEDSKQSNCLIVKNESQATRIFNMLKQQQIQPKLVALVDFWGSYIGKTHDSILQQSFKMCLNLFDMFMQNSNLYLHRQAYSFIKNILKYIEIMRIFVQNKRQNLIISRLKQHCLDFITKISQKIPFIIKKTVEYGFYYSQIGEIILELFKFQGQIPDIIIKTILFCDYLKPYIINLLKGRNSKDQNQTQLIAMHLINKFQQMNILYPILHLEGCINVVKILAHELLLDDTTMMPSAILLYNLIDCDRDHNFQIIFEMVQYAELFQNIQYAESNKLIDIFQLLVKIMTSYPQNINIYNKLLVQNQLQSKMRYFYSCKQNQQKKGYAIFARLVRRNIQFFINKYYTVVQDMIDNIDDLNFEQMDLFASRVNDELSLTGKYCQNSMI